MKSQGTAKEKQRKRNGKANSNKGNPRKAQKQRTARKTKENNKNYRKA